MDIFSDRNKARAEIVAQFELADDIYESGLDWNLGHMMMPSFRIAHFISPPFLSSQLHRKSSAYQISATIHGLSPNIV